MHREQRVRFYSRHPQSSECLYAAARAAYVVLRPFTFIPVSAPTVQRVQRVQRVRSYVPVPSRLLLCSTSGGPAVPSRSAQRAAVLWSLNLQSSVSAPTAQRVQVCAPTVFTFSLVSAPTMREQRVLLWSVHLQSSECFFGAARAARAILRPCPVSAPTVVLRSSPSVQ